MNQNSDALLRAIFRDSLDKADLTLLELTQVLNRERKPLQKVYSLRAVSWASRMGQSSGRKKPHVDLITRLAEMPFFWNPYENRYWSSEEIELIIQGTFPCTTWRSPEEEFVRPDTETYVSLVKKVKQLSSKEKVAFMTEILKDFDEPERVNLTNLAYIRLPILLRISLAALGFDNDYYSAAKSVMDGCNSAELACCLESIILRSPSFIMSFNKDAAQAIAFLCCHILRWDHETPTIDPNKTYSDVGQWLNDLSSSQVPQCTCNNVVLINHLTQ
jgi:hypothetical protein